MWYTSKFIRYYQIYIAFLSRPHHPFHPCTHLTHLVTGSDSLHQLSRIEELHVMNYSASLQELYTSGHDVLTVIQRQIVTNVVLLYDGLALWVIHA